MSTKVHANGNCLMVKSKPYPPPSKIGYECNDAEDELEYSDGGYPTLPRPKVILSVPRPGSPWSVCEASRLQTVPVRFSKCARTAGGGSVPKSSSNADCCRIHDREQATNKRSDVARRSSLCKVNEEDNKATLVHSDRIVALSTTSTKPALSRRSSAPVETVPRNSRVVALSQAYRERACSLDVSTMSQGKQKESKRSSRTLSFSFGSSSEKKRRQISIFGTLRRHNSSSTSDDAVLKIPLAKATAPASPILVGRRNQKNASLSSSLRFSEIQQNCILEESGSCSSVEEWVDRHPNGTTFVERNRFASCRDLNGMGGNKRNSLPKSSSLQKRTSMPNVSAMPVDATLGGFSPDESPGPTSLKFNEVSSVRESIESLTHSVQNDSLDSNPPTPSLRQSPSLQRGRRKELPPLPIPRDASSPFATPPRFRKFSDPAVSTPEPMGSPVFTRPGNLERNGRVSKLRKGHSFCVRTGREAPDWREMRHHVVRFLLETEQSYVQSLRTIIKVYLEPLRRPQAASLVDPNLVKDIFYQIPEVCSLHENFLLQVTRRVEQWHPLQKIGDIFINTFSGCQLMDIYSKFIHNFMRAKAAIEIAKQSRPMFAKFLEQRAKDSQGKLTLDDLLIKPVQRIPRYVLFIKDLLKHTTPAHPDHAPLQQAVGELTLLAERVNESEREYSRLERQRELLAAVDGLALLLNSQSALVRYDMVTEIKGNVHKRDRFLILYSDVLVCAAARRKSTSFKRSSLLNLNSMLPEALRYKIKWHASLTELSIAQIQAPVFERRKQNTLEKQLENLRKDEAVLQQMLDLSNTMHKPHQPLSSMLREMLSEVREGITEKKEELENLPQDTARIDLISYAANLPAQYALVFPSQRIRNSWEKDFLDTKLNADNQAPPTALVAPPTSPPPVESTISHDLQFLHPLQLHSGRMGTQLTCAAVGLPVDCDSSCCLWVCCSDSYGYSGQVCLLDLEHSTQPQLVANITVSNSRILTLSAIPMKGEESPCPNGTQVSTMVDKSSNGLEEKEKQDTSTEKPSNSVDGIQDPVIEKSGGLVNGTLSEKPASSNGTDTTQDGTVEESAQNGILVPGESLSTEHLSIGPREAVLERAPDSISLDSSSGVSHVSVSRTPSSASEYQCAGEYQEKDEGYNAVSQEGSGSLGSPNSSYHSATPGSQGNNIQEVESPKVVLTTSDEVFSFEKEPEDICDGKKPSFLGVQFHRVRSNSAPPDTERVLEAAALELGKSHRILKPHAHSPPPSLDRADKNTLDRAKSSVKAWLPLTLRPSRSLGESSEGGSSCCCMWLGTEGGQIHIYGEGSNLRSRSNRRTLELSTPVHCIRYFKGSVYAGLGDGSVAVLSPEDSDTHTHTASRHCIALGSSPVVCCVPVQDDLWAACGGNLHQIDPTRKTAKLITTLPASQAIHSMVAMGNSVWVSVGDSPILHLYHASSASLLTTVDCTKAVMDVLRGYDPISRQQKTASLKITSLLPCSEGSCLLIGTSAGVILSLPLPPTSSEPRPLPHPPTPAPLPKGHKDRVHFLSSMLRDGRTLVLTGGNGLEDFAEGHTSPGVSESTSCLLLWNTPV